jgi:hypothetical protein
MFPETILPNVSRRKAIKLADKLHADLDGSEFTARGKDFYEVCLIARRCKPQCVLCVKTHSTCVFRYFTFRQGFRGVLPHVAPLS